MNNTHLILITNDLYDIANRLKSVKGSYELYFNKQQNRYEVHDKQQVGSSLAFVVPYAELDARTVDYAYKTSVQNADKLFAEIDEQNVKLQKEQTEKYVSRAINKLDKKEDIWTR